MSDAGTVGTSFLGWMAAAGSLLMLIALSSAYLRRLPISTSSIYLATGLGLSPLGLDWLRIDIHADDAWLEYLTQAAVIVSLFIGGLKLRLPFFSPAWGAVPRLAGPLMIATIVGIAALAHSALGLDTGLALLLGAVLAPTDPVLASAVSVNDAKDRDRVRYGLSGEAGLNDGAAFPFVVFALGWLTHQGPGTWIWNWLLERILWATPVALVSGYLLGKYVGRLAVWIRTRHRGMSAPTDFLALALIALSYVAAELVHAWGFLAVFAAGVGMRRAELAIVARSPHPAASHEHLAEGAHPPAEDLVGATLAEEAIEQPAVAVGATVAEALSFGDTAERLLELALVIIVGVALAAHWDARAIPLAVFLFCVLRPAAAHLVLLGTATSLAQRSLMGWFGVRGVGSVYYIAYALTHAPSRAVLDEVTDLTVSIVALSILAHGITSQPFLAAYERLLSRGSPAHGVHE